MTETTSDVRGYKREWMRHRRSDSEYRELERQRNRERCRRARERTVTVDCRRCGFEFTARADSLAKARRLGVDGLTCPECRGFRSHTVAVDRQAMLRDHMRWWLEDWCGCPTDVADDVLAGRQPLPSKLAALLRDMREAL